MISTIKPAQDMRTLKNVLVFLLIFSIGGMIGWWQLGDNGVFKAITFCILALFLFNLTVRNSITFKPYFTSRWNLFSSKYRRQFIIDIPVDLAFDKLLEVINGSPYKLKYSNHATLEILATTKLSLKSWGENIYLDIRSIDGKSVVDLCSVAILGMHSWGKNEDNCSRLVQMIEDSLII